jgi:hypothetical protein
MCPPHASTLTLIKRAGGGDGTFGYTLTGGGGLEPELTITTAGGEGKAIEPGINPGEYEIKESSLPLDWFFEDLTCTTTGGAVVRPSGATAKIRIPITGGATVTCTYTNLLPATVLPEGEPRIVTAATSTMLGGTIKDTALISGLHEPTGEGTLTFHLYSDEACTVSAGFSYEIKGITEDKEYASAAFTPAKLGKYYWRVVFSGDDNNFPAESVCNAPGEVSEVTQTQPAISTTATESVGIGEPIKDTAEIAGLVKPTGKGTITFHLYSDEGCTVPVPGFSSPSETVTENRSFTSAAFPTVNAGLYYWIAEFSGDEHNKPVNTECRDGGEISVVREAKPAIKTSATLSAIVGQTIKDTATLEGLVNAEGTGKVTFKLFDNSDCEGSPCTNSRPPAESAARAPRA